MVILTAAVCFFVCVCVHVCAHVSGSACMLECTRVCMHRELRGQPQVFFLGGHTLCFLRQGLSDLEPTT